MNKKLVVIPALLVLAACGNNATKTGATSSPNMNASPSMSAMPTSPSPSTGSSTGTGGTNAPNRQGTLQASPSRVKLDSKTGAGYVTLTAVGGPVTWSTPTNDDLRATPMRGTIQAGKSMRVSIEVFNAGMPKQKAFTFAGGRNKVTVTCYSTEGS